MIANRAESFVTLQFSVGDQEEIKKWKLESRKPSRERVIEITWYRLGKGEGGGLMGNSQGRDNVKKRLSRRKKTERLAAAKKESAKKAAKK